MPRFNDCLAFVLAFEGGYVDHPDDKGGPTNRGITQRTYWEWLAHKGRQPKDVQDITLDEVKAIYLENYWQPGKADKLQEPLDLIHFDACVNHGVGLAGRMLQSALGMTVVDGIIGHRTLTAAASASPKLAAIQYAKRRLERYIVIAKTDPSQMAFLLGWAHRLGEVLRAL